MNTALQAIGSVVQSKLTNKADPTNTCPRCACAQPVPDFVNVFSCRQCGAELNVPASLQLALYEPETMERGDVAQPVLMERVPTDARLRAHQLEDATWQSVSDAVSKGSLGRALEQSVSSVRGFGLAVAIAMTNGQTSDYSFRVGSFEERSQLLRILQDRVISTARLSQTNEYAATLATFRLNSEVQAVPLAIDGFSSRNAPTQAWVCDQCTYEHTGHEIGLTSCAVCSATRAEPADPHSIPLPSAPSLPEVLASESADTVDTPWTCQRCTYRHLDGEAALLMCAMCSAERGETSPSEAKTVDLASSAPQPKSTDAASTAKFASEHTVAENARARSTDDGGACEEDENGVCAVCLEQPADAAVVPCGHMCGCYACLEMLQTSSSSLCPICRGPVDSVIRIYRS